MTDNTEILIDNLINAALNLKDCYEDQLVMFGLSSLNIEKLTRDLNDAVYDMKSNRCLAEEEKKQEIEIDRGPSYCFEVYFKGDVMQRYVRRDVEKTLDDAIKATIEHFTAYHQTCVIVYNPNYNNE